MKFKELSDKVQKSLIDDYINWIVESVDFEELNHNTNLYKAYKKSEDMRTPWFIGSYIWEYCENQIIKELSKYKYDENGEILHN